MLLAIDTASRVLSLALHDGDQVIAETTWTSANQHTVELMPAIWQMLDHAKLKTKALSLLAISQGPGSFNGLRIGFSTAKGLAFSIKKPMLAIPTLDVIAAAQPRLDSADGTLLATVQAGRGRVCVGSYRWQTDRWTAQQEARILEWPALIESVSGETLITGEIDSEGRAAIAAAAQAGKPVRMALPAFGLRRAGFLAELAWQRWRVGATDESMTAVPIYLHQPGVPHP